MRIERGAIHRVNLEPTFGSQQQGVARPCLILTETGINLHRRTVGVVPLSSSGKSLPPIVVSVPSAGLPTSVAICDQLRAVDKQRIGAKVGELSTEDLEAVEAGVKEVFGLK